MYQETFILLNENLCIKYIILKKYFFVKFHPKPQMNNLNNIKYDIMVWAEQTTFQRVMPHMSGSIHYRLI